jgi:zinc D-Ala-D-Ala carboxypeptidase
MTPLEIFTLGKGLWSLYEKINEHFDDRKPQENIEDRRSNDPAPTDSWKYFKLSEFSCPCCGRSDISKELVNRLDYCRSLAGIPFRISSGFRCVEHNRRIHGKPRSAHLDGSAVDIKCPSGSIKATIIGSLFAGGIKRVGIYKNFVHADISKKLPYPMVWTG